VNLSIVIVNWNSKDHLAECIPSILAETQALQFEIIVIDSASYDGAGEMLREDYPEVRFIQSPENGGFAKSNNAAFAEAKGDYVLFLNPDTVIHDRSIERAHAAIQTCENPGVVGCRLLNTDGSIQTSCIQAFPTMLNQWLNIEWLRKRFPRARLWGLAPLSQRTSEPIPVDVVSGAFLMMRRQLFEAFGGFEEDYFMYSEDVDLCYRLQKAGYVNYLIPQTRVIHHGGGSSSRRTVNTFSSVMMLESRWKFFRKTRPAAYCVAYRLGMFFCSLARLAVVLVLSSFGQGGSRGDYFRKVRREWAARMKWTLGFQRWHSSLHGQEA
jgi:GT2 family glycosyltransferase